MGRATAVPTPGHTVTTTIPITPIRIMKIRLRVKSLMRADRDGECI
jgi:hypothetical protein